MQFDFDTVIDRRNTCSLKWDSLGKMFKQEDLLPLWVADMDFPSPQDVIDVIAERAKHGIFGYSMKPTGITETVASWLRTRHGWNVEEEWLVHVLGVVPSFSLLVLAFSHPGDKVVVQSPIYSPFFNSVLSNGRQPLYNRLVETNSGYGMDLDSLAKAIDRRTRMIFFCSPHNPTGRVWTLDELTRLGEMCLERKVLIVSDDLHCDLVYSGHRHTPIASISAEFAANSITFISATKSFNVAGLGSAIAVIPDRTVREQFQVGMERLALNHVNTFSLLALEAAFRCGGAWLDELLRYLEGNRDFLASYLEENLPSVRMHRPEATYLAWLDFARLGLSDKDLGELLVRKAKVFLNPGTLLGPGGEGHARLNFACSRSVLEEGLERIAGALMDSDGKVREP